MMGDAVAADSAARNPQATWRRYLAGPDIYDFQRVSCREFLSDSPPADLNGSPWLPACSLFLAKYLQDFEHVPYRGVKTRLGELLESLDHCSAREQRGTAEYKPLSQEETGKIPLSSEEESEEARRVSGIQQEISVACCASLENAERKGCEDSIRGIPLKWCVPQTDPKKPDSCTDEGTYYRPTESGSARLYDFFSAPHLSSAKALPLDAGEIHLSGLLSPRVEDEEMATHELFHGCSSVYRQSLIRRRKEPLAEAAYQELKSRVHPSRAQEGPSPCELSVAARQVYQKLWSDVAHASQETFRCLLSEAEAGTKRRFSEGECSGGCPRSHLEEAFATWFQYEWKFKHQYKGNLIDICYFSFARDAGHGLGADYLKCYLKTPAFAREAEKFLGCLKSPPPPTPASAGR